MYALDENGTFFSNIRWFFKVDPCIFLLNDIFIRSLFFVISVEDKMSNSFSCELGTIFNSFLIDSWSIPMAIPHSSMLYWLIDRKR